MDRFEAMRIFARVTEAGSFSAAARELGVGQPTVSKQIAALESHLGAKLIHRTSRRLTLTAAGQAYYEAATKLLTDLELAEGLIGSGAANTSGLLRLAVPAAFGCLHLIPLLPEFCDLYPDVTVDVVEADRPIHFESEGLDLAIRIGDPAESEPFATPIAKMPRITVAADVYLSREGEPRTLADLERHACVVYGMPRGSELWVFESDEGPRQYVPKGRVRASSLEWVRAAALAGLGIAQGPLWLFAADIARNALRQVLRDHPSSNVSIRVVFPSGRRVPSKVRAFVDFITATFARNPALRSQ